MLVNIEQFRKYDVPGPRYTSYPPAVHFTRDLPAQAVTEEIRRASSRDLSLYFHLPFCKTLCWYCGCNTVITKNQSQSTVYLTYLEKEIEAVSSLLGSARRVTQIHLGGGTPTFLLPDELRALGKMVASRFEFARKVEASVEIDPRRLTFQHVIALREAGMSRASIGVQDFNFEVQRAVNRIQPFDETRKAVRWLREQGFGSIAIDLIYGLPHQTLESFAQTLERLAKSGVRRLAVMCPSFTADCLETLEEIAIRGRRLFLQAGGTDFTMIRALNDRAEWGNAIAQILGSFERG